MSVLILKMLITAVLLTANIGWVFLTFLSGAMDPQGRWDNSLWWYMGVPTALNILILWSMWE